MREPDGNQGPEDKEREDASIWSRFTDLADGLLQARPRGGSAASSRERAGKAGPPSKWRR